MSRRSDTAIALLALGLLAVGAGQALSSQQSSVERSPAIGLSADGARVAAEIATAVSAAASSSPSATTTATATPRSSVQPPPASSPAPLPQLQTLTEALPQLKAWVSENRGLAYRYALPVVIAEPRVFQAAYRASDRRLSLAEPRVGTRLSTARFSTLHDLRIVRSRFEYDDYYATSDAKDSALAYYDIRAKRIVVRDGLPAPILQQEIVRAFTLALLDQNFDLNRPELAADFEAALALRTLAEGDASRMINAFYRASSPAAQASLDRAQYLFGDAGGSPDALSIMASYPFLVGPQLVEKYLTAGGQAALDRALLTPPTTTEQLLDPRLPARPRVPLPRLPAGAQLLSDGVLGELGLALLLQEYALDPAAARGWAGDRYATYAVGRSTCTVVNVRTTSRAESDRLARAGAAILPVSARIGETNVLLQGCRAR